MAVVSIKQLENGVIEYDLGYSIVRIHPGKLTEEERKKVIIDAAQRFYKKAVQQGAL